MAELGTAEFEALRRTIRERGTVRPVLAVATLGGWAALALWAATGAGIPAPTLVPLVVLYAGFEAVAALHLGVERIGRYLQVEYEQTGASAGRAPRWETTAMAFGRTRASVAVDPLFSVAFLSALVLTIAKAEKITIKILEQNEMERLGMGALLGVARGSQEPPKFIILEYNGAKKKDERPVVLVGKTITFDTGGISLKPAENMEHMKADMTGGAEVLASIRAAARLKQFRCASSVSCP